MSISYNRYNLLDGDEKALLLFVAQKYYRQELTEGILVTIKESFIKKYLEEAKNNIVDNPDIQVYSVFNKLMVKFGLETNEIKNVNPPASVGNENSMG